MSTVNFSTFRGLGGIGVKGLTPTERLGNPAPRIAETPSGILNCVGLQNPGIDRFIAEQIPFLRQYDTAIIANVSGNTVEEYEGMVEKISDADVDLIEMNISCPNVKCGGMAFGTHPDMVTEVVSAAKKKAKKPLIVKLSPNDDRHHRDRAAPRWPRARTRFRSSTRCSACALI